MPFIAPTVRDWPDFMTGAGPASRALVDVSPNFNITYIQPRFDVSSWSMIQVYVKRNGGPAGTYQIEFDWHYTTDDSVLTPIAQRAAYVASTVEQWYVFPNFGPVMSFFIQAPAGPPNADFYVRIVGRNATGQDSAPTDILVNGNGALAPGVSAVHGFPGLSNCKVSARCDQAGGAAQMGIDVLTATGYVPYWRMYVPAADGGRAEQLWLPPGECRMFRSNLGGVAQNVQAVIASV